MGLKCKVPPTLMPVSLAQLKTHLRMDTDDFDSVLGLYLEAATGALDADGGVLGRALCTQTWEITFKDLPEESQVLPFSPVQSIVSVTYLDPTGAPQTLDPSTFVFYSGQDGLDYVKSSTVWPPGSLYSVTYVAGYADPTLVPAPIKAVILMIGGSLYANPESQLLAQRAAFAENPLFKSMLAPYRIWSPSQCEW